MSLDVLRHDAFERFCGGVFWNETQTFGPSATWPEFSDCFQSTILVWVPCGFLWLTLPLNLYYMITRSGLPINLSWLTLFKSVLSLTLFFLAIVELSQTGSLDRNYNYVPLNMYVSPVIKAVTFILALVLLHLERRFGFITSGIQFVFWLLYVLAGLVPFYTNIIHLADSHDVESTPEVERISVFYIEYAAILAQFLFHCKAEKVPYGQYEETDKERCPELDASFLSRLSFWWVRGILVKGYKETLEESHMWDMNPRDKSARVVPKFQSAWMAEVDRCKHKQRQYDLTHPPDPLTHSLTGSGVIPDESTPLLNVPPVDVKSGKKRKQFLPSLGKVLVKTYFGTLLLSWLYKLVYDILTFVSPLILNLLIEYTVDKRIAMWKGYVYAIAIFATAVVQSVFYHQCFQLSMPLGMRIKSAVIAAIYRKALVMNNESRQSATVGEIVNLMSVDAQRLQDVTVYLFMAWSSPLTIGLALYMLYRYMNVAIFAGLGAMFVIVLLNGVVVRKLQVISKRFMVIKDERLKLMNELLSGIKVIKLYAWEESFEDKVGAIRARELSCLRSFSYLIAVILFFATFTPFIVTLVTFATYIFITPNHTLDAANAFVSLSLLNILRMPLTLLPIVINFVVQAQVSLSRVRKYLNHGELDQNFVTHDPNSQNAITVEDGTFAWDKKQGVTLANVNLEVPDGALVAVVGKVGAGKSSLVSAILGEMEKLDGHVNVRGSVAYVPQEAWIQNATVRDNILFGSSYVQQTYEKVIGACALQPDLVALASGDKTEIGEKGINLSGGQKQRVSLARAVYNDADIYLLDDPLSAVDSHVGKHIFEEVISDEGLLSKKTRLLVTHGIHWLPRVDLIVVVTNGKISEVGTYEELLNRQGSLASHILEYVTNTENDEDDADPEVLEMKAKVLERVDSIMSSGDDGLPDVEPDVANKLKRRLSRMLTKSFDEDVKKKDQEDHEEKKPKDRLIEDEHAESGKVKMSTYGVYLRSLGIPVMLVIVVMYVAYSAVALVSKIWISKWTDDPLFKHTELSNTTRYRERNNMYLGVYGGLGGAQAIAVLLYSVTIAIGVVRASTILHRNLLSNIMKCPMSFFDTTPLGRIVNRFSRDIETVDSNLPQSCQSFLGCTLGLISTIIVISYSIPIFLAVVVPVSVLYYFIQRFYIPTLRQLKRLESTSRSPIFTNFTETINGVSSIRAYNVEARFISESDRRVDKNLVYYYATISSNRWLGIRLEFVSNLLVLAAAIFTVIGRNDLEGGQVGLSLTYALQITASLNFLVRTTSDLEANAVAVERIKEYTEAASEPSRHNDSTRPDEGWPDVGDIQFTNYKTRYRPGLDLVLNGITANIAGGSKVGIVGRTGAGKSSLTLALFRLIEAADGRIVIDGVEIARLGLHDLRSNLTILPQDPVLFAGTLRMNLDPLAQHTDDELWWALEQAHLKTFVAGLATGLDYSCGEGGSNLSVGQRQLVCLARTLLRKTKVLVLDEATAAVDIETDELIQKTIRTEFSDCTVLTIAHRLHTIMDSDRIMVLDKGQICEFDSPQNLLQNKHSEFYSLAKEAGLV